MGRPPPVHRVARSPHLDKRSLSIRRPALGRLLGIPSLLVPHIHPRGAGGVPSCRLEDPAVVRAPPAASTSRWILPAGVRRVYLLAASRDGIRLEMLCNDFPDRVLRLAVHRWCGAVLCSRLCRYHTVFDKFELSVLVISLVCAVMRLQGNCPWPTRVTLFCRVRFHDMFSTTICFTICLFISPDLDGQRALQTRH
jgi:hypothetical protein